MRIDSETKRYVDEKRGTLSRDMLIRKLVVLWCSDETLRDRVKLSDYSSVKQLDDLQKKPYVEE